MLRRRRVLEQSELAVDHHAARTSGDACGTRMEADAPLHPNGRANFSEDALEKNERRLVRYASSCFLSFDHEPIHAGSGCRACFFDRGHLREYRATAPLETTRRRGYDHHRHVARQLEGPAVHVLGYAHPEPLAASALERD